MQGDIALAGFMMTAEEWAALDAPSRELLRACAIEVRADDFAQDEAVVEIAVYAVGTAPITDEEATV
jgi:hypothetical protein